MANKALFATIRGMLMPAADTVNHVGAPAYTFSPRHALAQYAATGYFGRTFYATADEQLSRVLEILRERGAGVRCTDRDLCAPHILYEGHAGVLCAWLLHARRTSARAGFAK